MPHAEWSQHSLFARSMLYSQSIALTSGSFAFTFAKPAAAFKAAFESLGLEASGGRSVGMQKIWHLVQVSCKIRWFIFLTKL